MLMLILLLWLRPGRNSYLTENVNVNHNDHDHVHVLVAASFAVVPIPTPIPTFESCSVWVGTIVDSLMPIPN